MYQKSQKINKFHVYIWNQHTNSINIITNMPSFGLAFRENQPFKNRIILRNLNSFGGETNGRALTMLSEWVSCIINTIISDNASTGNDFL